MGRRMVHGCDRSRTARPSRIYRCRKYSSALVFRIAALLDSAALAGESGGQYAGNVGCMGVNWNRRYPLPVASSGKATVSSDVSFAVGTFAVSSATRANGAL